jgi:hypothetical protein
LDSPIRSSTALSVVQDFVSRANSNIESRTATTITIHDTTDPLYVTGNTETVDITGFFPDLASAWDAPTDDDPQTHSQPFLLIEAYNATDKTGNSFNRFYLLWWDLTRTNTSDSYIKSLPITASDLPGWADSDTIWGLTTLWTGDIVNAMFIGTYCWGDIS